MKVSLSPVIPVVNAFVCIISQSTLPRKRTRYERQKKAAVPPYILWADCRFSALNLNCLLHADHKGAAQTKPA